MSKLRNFDWRQEAQYLREVQAKGLWAKNSQATSFSDWLKLRAETDGIKISLLWRYLRVGRFVVELNIGGWQQVTSPLGIPEGINADSLELLEKINRVATAADFNPLAEDLYAKKIKRTQLLKLWQIYRQALPSGQTARGRGKPRPVLAEQDTYKQQLSFQQKVLRKLADLTPLALGYANEMTLRIVHPLNEHQKRLGYVAVLLVLTEYRVMDAVLIVFDQDQFEQAAALAYLKYERVWLIQPSQPNTTASPPSIAAYPPTWGVIAADADSLQVLRTPPSPPPSIPLALSELLIDTP
jgi:hypothetical protein